MDIEAAWTIGGWLRDWFGFSPVGHFWWGWLAGLLGSYLMGTILSIGRPLLCSVYSARVVDRSISRLRWLACVVFGLASHVIVDWGLLRFLGQN